METEHFTRAGIFTALFFAGREGKSPLIESKGFWTVPFLLLLVLCFGGCAGGRVVQPTLIMDKAPQMTSTSTEKTDVAATHVAPVAEGIIFGKADFRGLLKVQYVKLNIVEEDLPQKQYELLFGERDQNNEPVWSARILEPHYFFLDLPVGKYRIIAISIPVGTTLATEPTDIAFTVEPQSVIYLGTLRVTGTDQKIRFGGVPLLRPGFDYKVEILNEIEEAITVFRMKYPSMLRDIQVKLMRAMRIQAF